VKSPKNYRMFNYRKTLLPNEFLSSLEEGVQNIEEAKTKTGFSVGYPGWNLLYYTVLCNLDRDGDNIILETGTNLGCSTIMLGQALKDSGLKGHIYSIELQEVNYLKAKENINKAGLSECVDLFCGKSIEFIKRFVKNVNSIRFAFLDGCHDQDYVVKEFELIYPKLTDESMVFFDNTYKIANEEEDQRVNGAIRLIKERFKGNLINFKNTSWYTPGQAIWQKQGFRKDWDDVEEKRYKSFLSRVFWRR